MRRRAETGFLPAVILLALILRTLRLDLQPLWWDEGYSVWFATHSLGQMVGLTAGDIHPPLYYALLRLWIGALGTGPIGLRLLSVLFGVLAVPAVYLAGRRLLSRRAARLAALLVAFNPLHIFYSQEVRMYGLVALLSAGVIAAAWRVFRDGEEESLLTYILLTIAALYTQYYAVFLPIGLTIYAFWRWRRDRRALSRWLAGQLVVALLYLPWVLYAAPRLVLYVGQKVVHDADRPLSLVVYLGRHLAAFLAGHLEGSLAPWWPAALLLLLPLAIGWLHIPFRSPRHPVTLSPCHPVTLSPCHLVTLSPCHLLTTLLVSALTLGWLIGLRYPFFPERGERLLLLALPPFVLLIAAGVDALWARWQVAGYATLALLGAVAGVSLVAFYTVPRYVADDYRPLIGRTIVQGLPEDTVFCVYPWQVGYWRSYSHPAGPNAILTPDAAWGEKVTSALDAALSQGRVWFPAHLALGGILETQIEAHLAERGIPFGVEWYGPGTRLSAWAPAAAANLQPVAAGPFRFPLRGADVPAIELAGVAVAAGPIPAANAVLPLALSWRSAAPPPVLGVSVRLTDPLGQIWAQHDYEPLGSLRQPGEHPASLTGNWSADDHLGLLIPAGTPAGHYTLEAAVHLKGDVRPLDAFGADGKGLGASARLCQVTVAPAGRDLGPERLPIGARQALDLEDGLRFLGYTASEAPAAPGELRKVSLFWQTTAWPSADYVAFLQLLDRSGQVAAGWESSPGAAFPTSQWAPGTLIRTQAHFRPPATLADGRYQLIAGLFRASDKARLHTPAGADYVSLGTVTVAGRSHDMRPARPQHPADVRLGPFARLVGYDLELPAESLKPGGFFPLTLYWQATGTTDRGFTVFVHLLDEAGDTRGYGDSEPGQGRFPTASWLPGEYLTDRHVVGIVPDAVAGRYRLAIGLYDPTTGERLRTPDGADRVVLEEDLQLSAVNCVW